MSPVRQASETPDGLAQQVRRRQSDFPVPIPRQPLGEESQRGFPAWKQTQPDGGVGFDSGGFADSPECSRVTAQLVHQSVFPGVGAGPDPSLGHGHHLFPGQFPALGDLGYEVVVDHVE